MRAAEAAACTPVSRAPVALLLLRHVGRLWEGRTSLSVRPWKVAPVFKTRPACVCRKDLVTRGWRGAVSPDGGLAGSQAW